MKTSKVLVLTMVISTSVFFIWPGRATKQNSVARSALAQSPLSTATPHMTCVMPNSATSPFWTRRGLMPDGPGQTRVISIPSIHPRCQSLFTNVRPMHALVDNVAHLKIWNESGELIFDNGLNLQLSGVELRSPDCTSQIGYELHSGIGHTYEVRVNYECCFSCYQTATPSPGTTTPPAP